MYVSSHTSSTYVKPESSGKEQPSESSGEEQPPQSSGEEQPPRPRTKAAQREATTAALITTARELFAERGYADVGTEEIVQRAGLTRGALYHHFRGGKEELFRAVLVQISAEVVRQVAEVAAGTDDPWEVLLAGSEAFLDACANPEVQRIMLIDGPSVLGWDVWRAIDTDYGLGLLDAACSEQWMQAGSSQGRARRWLMSSPAPWTRRQWWWRAPRTQPPPGRRWV